MMERRGVMPGAAGEFNDYSTTWRVFSSMYRSKERDDSSLDDVFAEPPCAGRSSRSCVSIEMLQVDVPAAFRAARRGQAECAVAALGTAAGSELLGSAGERLQNAPASAPAEGNEGIENSGPQGQQHCRWLDETHARPEAIQAGEDDEDREVQDDHFKPSPQPVAQRGGSGQGRACRDVYC